MASVWTLTGQLSPGARPRCIRMQAMPFRVGRRTDVSLCISRQSVSSVHAQFDAVDDSLFLTDLQSRNGTFVNGDRVIDRLEVRHEDLIQFADMPFRLGRQLNEFDSRTVQEDVCDRALGLVQFDKLITDRELISYFQPVVQLADNQTLAYEVLSRSRLVGLEKPAAMFRAAAQLNLEFNLSRLMRIEGIRTSATFADLPHVFLNTHPTELAAEGLLESMVAIRRMAPSQKITVEIHEAAVTDVSSLKELRARLNDLDMRLAFDDFGAGQARLCELAEVRPDYLKFDRQMIQDIHRASPQRQQMLSHLVQLVVELGVVPLAEGIECGEEGVVCREMGFVLAQGYFYGMPRPASAYALPPQPSPQNLICSKQFH
jgi:EAL domain-containing protein (putative c-di-GMP-specific phosphodiesterase class I)